jgi:hypothetical protein
VFTLVGVEVCRRAGLFANGVATGCIVFAMIGLLVWFRGQLQYSRRAAGSNQLDHPLAFLRSFRYWGFILTTSAVLVYVVAPKPRPEAPPVAIAKPVEPPPLTNAPPPPPETNAPAAIEFPPLKLSGVIYNGDDSTAVINGRTLQVGRYIGEVRIVAIEPRAVTVELSGERMALHLE